MPFNPYVILAVPTDAGDGQIKKAYRTLAKQYHPDVNRNDPAAEKKFQDIGEAYRILSDPQARQAYDKQAQATAGRTRQPRRPAAGEATDDGFDIANMAQGMQNSFERYFGYDPHTGRVSREDKLNPQAKPSANPLDATAMFNSFFTHFKK